MLNTFPEKSKKYEARSNEKKTVTKDMGVLVMTKNISIF
jgi:hypothetical protein